MHRTVTWILAFLLGTPFTLAFQVDQYCKCTCTRLNLTNTAVIPGGCSLCSKTFCSQRENVTCTAVDGSDTTWQSLCFERDSIKDRVIVHLFVLIVSGLLVGALMKPYAARIWQWLGPKLPAQWHHWRLND